MSVSVIIPAYNASKVIGRAIDSVLAQTTPATELVIVDDASNDNTREIVTALAAKNSKIRLVALNDNGGPSRARNVGIATASSDWIAFLDSDDAWKATRLAALLMVADQGEFDIVADNQVFYDAVSETEGRVGFVAPWREKVIDANDLFESDIQATSRFSYGLLKPLIRRQLLLDLDLRYNETMRYNEDFFFLAELLLNGAKVKVINAPNYIYTTRIGEQSRKLSPHSKSIPRFDLVVQSSDILEQKYHEKISAPLRNLIRLRRTEKRLIHLSNVARQLRRDGKFAAYMAFLIGHPDLIAFLANAVWKRGYRSIGRAFSNSKQVAS